MKELWKYIKPYRSDSILAPLFKLLESLMDLLVPLVVASIINKGIGEGDMHHVIVCFAILLGLAAAGMLFSFTAQYFAARASVGFASDVRQSLFDHIMSLSYSRLDVMGTDTLITRMTSDINQVQNGLNLGLRLLLRSPFIVFGAMIMAFTIDVRCALIFAGAIPVLSVLVFGIMLKSIPMFARVQKTLDKLLGMTRENLTGVRVIRAFCKEQTEIDQFDSVNKDLTEKNEAVGRLSALMNPGTYLLINIATILLIHQGALRVHAGSLLQGDVVALYNYMAQIIVELIKLASLIITLNKSLACGDRIAAVFRVERGMEYPEKEPSPVEYRDEIIFDHVYFSYEGSGEDAVEDIDFKVRKGTVLGIIGGTGSGKSTVISLIPRFYDATEGKVIIEGHPVQDYPAGSLNAKIGIVPQKAVLFEGTIRENLLWGNSDATDEELWAAIDTAQAREVVEGKEGMLDYMIEQNGRNLSGGQKQRLTIARALVKKPEILILDDSASALDFATDLRLRQAIHKLGRAMTVIIVSQRTSSVRSADAILVLDDGKKAGFGTHDQLLRDCRIYQEIYDSQYPGLREGVPA